MSVETINPRPTQDEVNARVRDYLTGQGFAMQSDIATAVADKATKGELATAVGNITLPPVPYNVPQSLLTLGNGVLAGIPIDRPIRLTKYTYRLLSLVGLNALLNIELKKNGATIPGTAVAVNTGSLTATVVLGSPVDLVAGDYLELWRTGLLGTSPIPGAMYGTFILS